jgi:G:T/U-mismatch repair DNA glycosylase
VIQTTEESLKETSYNKTTTVNEGIPELRHIPLKDVVNSAHSTSEDKIISVSTPDYKSASKTPKNKR